MKSNKLGILLAAVAVSVLFCGCSKKPPAAAEQQAIAVLVETVQIGTIEQVITLTGELKPQVQVELSPRMAGRLERLSLDDGTPIYENTPVVKGQVLAVLEHRELSARVDQLNASIGTAEAAIRQAKAELADKQKNKVRMENLFKEGSMTEQQKDLAATAFEVADAMVQSTEARLTETQASLQQAQVLLDEAFVKSPIDGVVSRRYVDEGNMVNPASPMLSLLPMEKLKFLVDVPAQYLSTIVPDKTNIRLAVDAYPKENFPTKVEKIYPAISSQTRTFTMELSVDNRRNPDGTYLLRPGMYATAGIVLDRRDNAVVVPADSLVRLSGKYLAYVVENNVAIRKDVEVGLWSGRQMEIRSGLSAGQRLVIGGQHKLTDNTPVEIIEAAVSSDRSGQK